MAASRFVALLSGLLLGIASAPAPAGPASPPFDADKTWSSFVKLLREEYGYFDRAGVDGDAILSAFASRARAARSDKEFVDTLQLVSHNFADPHFIVGPFDPDDWAIIPTASDLFGTYDGATYRIVEARADGDAATEGVRSGMTVVRIDGRSPRAAIEDVTGRPSPR